MSRVTAHTETREALEAQIISGADPISAIAALRSWSRERLSGRIIALASDKGGIGKTTLAVELAYCLDAVLVDLDWHKGNSSRSLGWRFEERVTSPVLAALQAGRTPRPIRGTSKPDLVPCGPEMEDEQPPANVVADALTAWAAEWGRCLIVDSHPGGGPAANGAASAAHAVLSPAPLAEKDLEALSGWCEALEGYPMIAVPNKVAKFPPMPQLMRLKEIATEYGLLATSPVPYALFLERRKARTAVCSARSVSKNSEPFIGACTKVAWEVAKHVA